MGHLKLFDGEGDSSDDDLSKIEIDQDFAKRYEHNKKREELQRYEELKKQGRVDDSDSEESSSEEEELIKPNKKIDKKFFDALIKVKNQDPVLKDKESKLFDSEDEDEDDSGHASEKEIKKKKKPMYLKDVVSKHLIEAGPEFSDEETENEGDDALGNRVKSYSEEQKQIRDEVLEALNEEENDDEGDLLTLKSNGNKDESEEEEEEDEIGDKLEEYFGEDEKLDENTMFLKDYFRNRMWIDDGKNNVADELEFSEDEEEIEKQEDYEREFNFRFEENAGDRVMGHSRKVEGSVRKKDNARKSQRERKEERMAQAEIERKEELKRLKNLKKKEINEKLEKIREVAGIGKDGGVFLDEDDLEEEFDPEAYDRKMKEAFGDGYYDADDVDLEFGSDDDEDGIEKPDFDKEDELLGLPKGWDEVDKSGEGFKSTRQRLLKDRVMGDENVIGEDGDDEPKEEGKRKRKRKPSDVEKAVREELMEEYYKLDYEDTIGDLKTRFKYRQVNPKRYGLSPEEILMMDEKDLNQYVSLKKLAPYREKEWSVPRIKKLQIKQNEKLHNGDASVSRKEGRKGTENKDKATKEVVNAVGTEKSQPAELIGDASTSSRRSKRRQRQAELKLPPTRLMAYGKIPSKSKSKNH
ncbi:hypothetical protein ACS0TY_029885 [Phlomoides rotata]